MADEARFLLDSSVLLELLLNQKRADEVTQFFNETLEAGLYVTDFSVHSVAIMLVRKKRAEMLAKFVDDLFFVRGAQVVRLDLDEVAGVATRAAALGLDFDDAYQYVAAEKHNLTLVSFDADFDRTERGRKTPADVLKQ
jgi:predicted nucleic acid-binding protein